jgi:hypothetical protein
VSTVQSETGVEVVGPAVEGVPAATGATVGSSGAPDLAEEARFASTPPATSAAARDPGTVAPVATMTSPSTSIQKPSTSPSASTLRASVNRVVVIGGPLGGCRDGRPGRP